MTSQLENLVIWGIFKNEYYWLTFQNVQFLIFKFFKNVLN